MRRWLALVISKVTAVCDRDGLSGNARRAGRRPSADKVLTVR